jgi:hypothetical protein
MTYSESAENVSITFERALQELQDHQVLNEENLAEFIQKLGIHPTYNAGDVLRFLGY